MHNAASEAVVGPRDFPRVFNNIFLSLNFIGRVKKKRNDVTENRFAGGDRRRYFSDGEKRRPEMGLLFAGYPCTDPSTNTFCTCPPPPQNPRKRCEPEESYLRCSKRFDHRSHSFCHRSSLSQLMMLVLRNSEKFSSPKNGNSRKSIIHLSRNRIHMTYATYTLDEKTDLRKFAS